MRSEYTYLSDEGSSEDEYRYSTEVQEKEGVERRAAEKNGGIGHWIA